MHLFLSVILQEEMIQFVSIASGEMSNELKKNDSNTRKMLVDMVEKLVEYDPEFLLKVDNIFRIKKYQISFFSLPCTAEKTSTFASYPIFFWQ